MNEYLIVYSSWNNVGTAVGNIFITKGPSEDIYTKEEIRNIERQICETNGFHKAVILNIIPLNNNLEKGE